MASRTSSKPRPASSAATASPSTCSASTCKDILGGDVRRRSEVRLLEADEDQGRYARRIMRSYEKQFAGSPELAILHLVGMFDRPAKRELIDVLRKAPGHRRTQRHAGRTDANGTGSARSRACATPSCCRRRHPDEIDAHPLVREHFGERLKDGKTGGVAGGARAAVRASEARAPRSCPTRCPRWRRCSRRCITAARPGGIRRRWTRSIGRGSRDAMNSTSTKKLGAFGADLAALAGLFDPPWDRPVATLTEADQAFILSASRLRSPRARAAAGGGGADAGGAGARVSRRRTGRTPRSAPAISPSCI